MDKHKSENLPLQSANKMNKKSISLKIGRHRHKGWKYEIAAQITKSFTNHKLDATNTGKSAVKTFENEA